MKISIVRGLSSISTPKLIFLSKNCLSLLTTQPRFLVPELTSFVSELEGAVASLERCASEGISGSKVDRVNGARNEVKRWLSIVMKVVEVMANQPGLSDDKQLALVHEAGMKVRKSKGRVPQVFHAKRGIEPGTAELVAKGCVGGHEWQSTYDLVNFSNRVTHKSTTRSKTLISGLTPGEKLAFFHRAITPNDDSAWEGPVFLMII